MCGEFVKTYRAQSEHFDHYAEHKPVSPAFVQFLHSLNPLNLLLVFFCISCETLKLLSVLPNLFLCKVGNLSEFEQRRAEDVDVEKAKEKHRHVQWSVLCLQLAASSSIPEFGFCGRPSSAVQIVCNPA